MMFVEQSFREDLIDISARVSQKITAFNVQFIRLLVGIKIIFPNKLKTLLGSDQESRGGAPKPSLLQTLNKDPDDSPFFFIHSL